MMNKLEKWAVEVIEKAVKYGADRERKRFVVGIRKQADKYAVMGSPLDSIYKSDALYELADRIENE